MLKWIKYNIKKCLEILNKNKAYIVLGLVFLFIAAIAYEYYSQYFHVLKNPKKIKEIILSFKQYSLLAFLLLQIIQVVAFFIPGEVIQIAGGYIYGTALGGVISLIGISLGSAAVYSISRLFGKPLIRKIISNKQLNFFHKLLKLGSINFVVFLLYLIPGIPKDVLAYICGISDINFRNFILYSTLGRIPGIFISAFFGARMYSGQKGILIFIAVVMSSLFILGVIRGEKIIKSLVKKE
ncbi:TVP38/TMEM64 family protein [Clostridium sp. SYSU_GA19001]|uniref:TVP38/TMEM64 family protein n=1 Tax=Clostridium caldaquaticum TaxID=2940653 RepID=UPI0020779308|nr:TVP38/TMEM64 family protein [Clostridium caldaquaticum]MCM8711497.1 TVP38/TMEM64 family protein [Clostridium caldaquaticum]